jgi:hypothetical protein
MPALPSDAALLLDDAALVTHQCDVPVNLAGKSRPALGEISQHLRLSFSLRHSHQAKAFCRLILAMFCAFHDLPAFRANSSKSISKNHDSYIYLFRYPKIPGTVVIRRTHGGICAARSGRSQNNLALGVPPAEHCDGKHHFGLIEELRYVVVEAF